MRTFIMSLVVVSAGCVTQSTYDALKMQDDKTAASLAQRDKELDETRRALKSEEDKAKALADRMTQLESALGDTQKDKSALENALVELRKRKAEAEGRIAEFKALIDKFRKLIDSGKLKVSIREGRMLVELATDILFPSGSATLSKDGVAAITEVAELLKSIPDRKFQVEGHTDNIPTRSAAYKSNWELASARAITVLKTMTDAGMPPDRISAASFGDTIVVVPDLISLPGFYELQRVAP